MASYSTSVNQKCMKSLLRQLMSCNILKPTVCDKVMESLDKFLSSELVLHQEKIVNYKREQERLDDFYFNSVMDMKKYPEFSLLLKRQWKGGLTCVTYHCKKISVLNQCQIIIDKYQCQIIIDHMLYHGLTPETIDIPRKLLL